MDNFEYLMGEWNSFKEFERLEHSEIKERLLRIESKLDSKIEAINEDRWRIKGAIAVIGLLSGSLGAVIIKHLLV